MKIASCTSLVFFWFVGCIVLPTPSLVSSYPHFYPVLPKPRHCRMVVIIQVHLLTFWNPQLLPSGPWRSHIQVIFAGELYYFGFLFSP